MNLILPDIPIPDLAESAMLTRFTCKRWRGRVKDKEAARKVAAEYGTDAKNVSAYKQAIAKDALDAIAAIESTARTYHLMHTLPWGDDDSRLLSSTGYFEYMGQMAVYSDQFYAAVNSFLPLYPSLIESAKATLGSGWREADYPPIEEIQTKFQFGVSITPIATNDFRRHGGLPESERLALNMEYATQVQSALDTAMSDVWTRVYGVVSHMVERLRAYERDADGKLSTRLYDSVVDNVRDLVSLLPALNVTGDSRLDALRQVLSESLCEYDTEMLKENDSLRRSVADAAERILNDLPKGGTS